MNTSPEKQSSPGAPETHRGSGEAPQLISEYSSDAYDQQSETASFKRPDSVPDATEFAYLTLLKWVLGHKDRLRPHAVGLRAIAVTWVLRPEFIGNPSLLALSKRLGCTDSIISRYATQFRDRFGIQNRGQRSNATRRRMARAKRPAPAKGGCHGTN